MKNGWCNSNNCSCAFLRENYLTWACIRRTSRILPVLSKNIKTMRTKELKFNKNNNFYGFIKNSFFLWKYQDFVHAKLTLNHWAIPLSPYWGFLRTYSALPLSHLFFFYCEYMPWFMVKIPAVLPPLIFLHHQWKCQHNEQGRLHFSSITKAPLVGCQGQLDVHRPHFGNCWTNSWRVHLYHMVLPTSWWSVMGGKMVNDHNWSDRTSSCGTDAGARRYQSNE